MSADAVLAAERANGDHQRDQRGIGDR